MLNVSPPNKWKWWLKREILLPPTVADELNELQRALLARHGRRMLKLKCGLEQPASKKEHAFVGAWPKTEYMEDPLFLAWERWLAEETFEEYLKFGHVMTVAGRQALLSALIKDGCQRAKNTLMQLKLDTEQAREAAISTTKFKGVINYRDGALGGSSATGHWKSETYFVDAIYQGSENLMSPVENKPLSHWPDPHDEDACF